ncbi:MAG: transposase [Spirosomaceae bacterium]|nr:transposase [Spirosomataceae bacterium]
MLKWKKFYGFTVCLMMKNFLLFVMMNDRTGGPACFLIGNYIDPIAMQTGKVRKEHYAYEKKGSCCLLASIEPLTGNRLAQVHTQRTKKEYALFMSELAKKYPNATKIRVIQDNLNTHNTSSFYENLTAEEAFELSQKFEFYYTPKSASWLNIIEIEFSALSKQCLNCRISTQEILEKNVLTVVKRGRPCGTK